MSSRYANAGSGFQKKLVDLHLRRKLNETELAAMKQYDIDHPHWREWNTLRQFCILMMIVFILCFLARVAAKRREAELRDHTRRAKDSFGSARVGAEANAGVHDAKGEAGVRQNLERLHLDQYTSELLAHGYDDWPEILRLPEDRFQKLVRLTNMSANHADRLEEALSEQRRQRGIQRAWAGVQHGEEGITLPRDAQVSLRTGRSHHD